MGLNRGVFALGTLAAGAGLLAEVPAAAQAVAPTREELTRPQLAPPTPKSTLNVIGDLVAAQVISATSDEPVAADPV